MLHESLLILAGAPSDLLAADGAPSGIFGSGGLFRPSEVASLQRIAAIAVMYQRLVAFARNVLDSRLAKARRPVPGAPRPTRAYATLASTLLKVLEPYETLLVTLEAKVLRHDPSLVSLHPGGPPVLPVSVLLAEVGPWAAVLQGLESLVGELQQGPESASGWTAPALVALLYRHALSGCPILADLLARMQLAVESVWMAGFIAFAVHGEMPTAEGEGEVDDLVEADGHHSDVDVLPEDSPQAGQVAFVLREDALPALPCLEPLGQLEETVMQICLALSILHHLSVSSSVRTVLNAKRRGQQRIALPSTLQDPLRQAVQDVAGPSHPRFRKAIDAIESLLSDYLFTTYLTPDYLFSVLDSLSSVFLLRNPHMASSLLTEFSRLRSGRTRNLSPRELDVALLRAGVASDLDGSSSTISFEHFSYRLFPELSPEDEASLHPNSAAAAARRFSTLVLGPPLLLTYAPDPALSLFLTPQACQTYALVHSVLFTFLVVRERLGWCWSGMLKGSRERSRWTDEGGQERERIVRECAEIRRLMGWWVDVMVSHFWAGVVEPAVAALLSAVAHGSTSDTARLDFASLSALHSLFLGTLVSGLLLTNSTASLSMRGMLETCLTLCSAFERWEGDLFPALLAGTMAQDPDEANAVVQERFLEISALGEAFRGQVAEFFGLLSAGPGNKTGRLGMSRSVSASGSSFVNATQSNATLHSGLGFGFGFGRAGGFNAVLSDGREGAGLVSRVAEHPLVRSALVEAQVARKAFASQLLLKLDFSGWFSYTAPEGGSIERVLDGLKGLAAR